jgi:neutral amino acid transport system ATP-binding protein
MTVTRAGSAISVEVSDLVCTFGGVKAVNGATFAIPTGQVTALVGPNGAGKSTVLSAIAGSVAPTSGGIFHDAESIVGLPPHRVAQRGIIRTFQLSSEFQHMTVLENLVAGARGQPGQSFWGALLGKRYWGRAEETSVERARALLARFGLSAKADQYAGALSGGEKRMVEIMRAMMAAPDVFLLDEPFAGVNPSLARRVEDQLAAIREDGGTMLMIEHELGAVDRLCDSVVVMANGGVLAQGSMAELRANDEVIDAYLGR